MKVRECVCEIITYALQLLYLPKGGQSRETDRRTNGRADRHTDGQMIDALIGVPTDGWTDERPTWCYGKQD